jgi:hypothetical protein
MRRAEAGRHASRLNLRCLGPLVIHPKDKGFGHVVIKNMIEQAVRGSVELDFAGEGLHWSLQARESIFL